MVLCSFLSLASVHILPNFHTLVFTNFILLREYSPPSLRCGRQLLNVSST